MTEKILTNNSDMNRCFIEFYYDFKRRNGYSEGEIAWKREALENVLVPYRMDEIPELFRRNGFPLARNVLPVFQLRRISVLEEFRMTERTGYNRQHEFDPDSTPDAVMSLANLRARLSDIAMLLDALEPAGDLRRMLHRRRGPRGAGSGGRCSWSR